MNKILQDLLKQIDPEGDIRKFFDPDNLGGKSLSEKLTIAMPKVAIPDGGNGLIARYFGGGITIICSLQRFQKDTSMILVRIYTFQGAKAQALEFSKVQVRHEGEPIGSAELRYDDNGGCLNGSLDIGGTSGKPNVRNLSGISLRYLPED